MVKKEININFWDIIKEPYLSEKAIQLQKQNQYVFKVNPKATKSEIKKAIEGFYKVHVESIKVINVKPKRKSFRNIEGKTSGFKKAIVKLKEGEKIDILPT